jgi:hypothetical protein
MPDQKPVNVDQRDRAEQSFAVTAPQFSLPKGGGAIRGIGEKFAANPVTGTGSLTVPVFATPGRSGFGPQLSLSYDSGSGNSPFGFGWSLELPSITRRAVPVPENWRLLHGPGTPSSNATRMHTPENCRLLFGPYRTPVFKYGDVVICDVRGEVEIVGGRKALVLCGALARAVQLEAAVAVAYCWGVSAQTVTVWPAHVVEAMRAANVGARRSCARSLP